MEFRVYAAFGYVTKVVSNGRVNAELHATSHNWLRLLALCGIAEFHSAALNCDSKITLSRIDGADL